MSKLSDKPSSRSDNRTMNAQTLARDLVIAAAGERGWQTTRASWLRDAARKLGMTYTRCRSIFYGEARLIGADEWAALQRRAQELNIKATWQEAEHARLAMDLGERTPASLGGTASDRPAGAARGEEGRRAGAVPASRPPQ